MITIMIIDDDKSFRWITKKVLTKAHFNVLEAASKSEALTLLKASEKPQLILLDQNLKDGSGFDLLPYIQTETVVPVIFITGHSEIELAVKAIQLGATDYLSKPIDNTRLITTIRKTLQLETLKHENTSLKNIISTPKQTIPLWKSKAMIDIQNQINKVARTPYTVYIQGESGVGKELIAKDIHQKSGRDNLCIPVDCGAIPEQLIESELFGHVEGAFTDAKEPKSGLFETANKGTLFLDEIGNLSLSAQTRLLRVLEDKQVRKVGSTQTLSIDTRIIVATNTDIPAAIKKGLFREDLWHRLTEFIITIPPLRDRPEDIDSLSEHFLQEYGQKEQYFSKQTKQLFHEYEWPGNVRELKNTIRRAALLADTVIEPKDLQLLSHHDPIEKESIHVPYSLHLKAAVERTESLLIKKTLLTCNNNKLKASKQLGMYYASFCRKLKQYDIR